MLGKAAGIKLIIFC